MWKRERFHPLQISTVFGLLSIFLLCFAVSIASAEAQVIRLFDDGLEDDDEVEIDFDGPVIERGRSGAGQGLGTTRSIRLEYQRRGQSILVPAKVGRFDVYFLFDTGASYTTLTAEFARSIGAAPEANYPTVTVQTAGGMRETQFGLINRMSLGTQALENVSFTVCDPCGGGTYNGRPVVGLLGLNVLRRYRVSVDDSSGVVELQPHSEFDDRRSDIEPWISVEVLGVDAIDTQRTTVRLKISNLAPRQVRNLILQIDCTTVGGERRQTRTRAIEVRARGSAEESVRLNLAGCVHVEPSLAEATW